MKAQTNKEYQMGGGGGGPKSKGNKKGKGKKGLIIGTGEKGKNPKWDVYTPNNTGETSIRGSITPPRDKKGEG